MRDQPDFSTSPRPRRPPARDLLAIILGLLALGLALRTAWSARHEADEARERVVEARREVDVSLTRSDARLGTPLYMAPEQLERPILYGTPDSTPAVVAIPTDTTSRTLNLTQELIAVGQPYGLPYIQITAMLNPTNNPPVSPTLEGWSFEFVCEAAE